ncbi:glycosyltransferase family 2 protein [Leisingera daeponensis]|uniref:glycosyltransferase family 2 protein n=1 Tax=Leisingera daeponensis TaxID=405746 RepID=UPI001C988589|nr:glycosyltransferase family 2 protein [Leisingera daeponensis]MBY6059427.1 glycosyltransferase family 2 protein [Leisingera daeponensis]
MKALVVIPALNEALHIEKVIATIRASTDVDIWVVDGGSSDGTQAIVERLKSNDTALDILDNPNKIQACAVNLAAQTARDKGYEALVRLDAHAHYPDHFVEDVLSALDPEQGLVSVVVPLNTIGGNAFQNASRDTFNSFLGNGGSDHRGAAATKQVDHGHHAAFWLQAFDEIGGYDPTFKANEDAEFDVRLRAAGYRILLLGTTPVDYVPRATAKSLWGQYTRNGLYRARNLRKHNTAPKLRQLIPAIIVVALLGSLVLAPILPIALIIPGLYVGALVAAALWVRRKSGIRHLGLMVWVAAIAHIGFGTGLIKGYILRA